MVTLLIFVACTVIAVCIVLAHVRIPRRDVDALTQRLLEVAPGRNPRRSELSRGPTSATPDSPRRDRTGVLALYDDELLFVTLAGGESTRIALADISDVTRVRSVESMAPGNDGQPPEWLLKIEWRTGGAQIDGVWAVGDADDWIASLARARL